MNKRQCIIYIVIYILFDTYMYLYLYAMTKHNVILLITGKLYTIYSNTVCTDYTEFIYRPL